MSELRQDDFIGRRFGRLEVVSFVSSIANTTLWNVKCDCGAEKVMRRSNLPASKSCGCLTRERLAARATHGLTKPGQHHPLYSVWDGMKRRCHGSKPHKRYGQRGIIVCDRWRHGEAGKTGFECFLEDMGDRPSPTHSIDRYPDNDGNYEPSNCRWATEEEQQNNKSSNRVVEFEGVKMTLTQAIFLSGHKEATVWGRLHLGWTVERALTVPLVRRRV
jgi:hypothetical protein